MSLFLAVKKIVQYFIILLIFTPAISKAQFENVRDSVVQLYGVVMTADSLVGIPAVSVVVKGQNRGTITNNQGVFSIVVLKGDIVEFTHVSYKSKVVTIPTNLEGNQYSVVQLMIADTVYLPATIIRPRPTAAQFARDFANTKVPDDDLEIARKNTSTAKRRALMQSTPADGRSAIRQFVTEVYWDELDYLVVDMPPGTGDIHLTLVQTVPVTGVIIVTTPQDVALADAKKGIAMFGQAQVNVPIIGLVENMSYFTPAELPNNKYYIFGKEGGRRLAEEYDLPFLGQIPLVQSIREGGDQGVPIMMSDDEITKKAFENFAAIAVRSIAMRNASVSKEKIIETI